jgi:hypothetical protein
VAAICSNWDLKLGDLSLGLWGFFNNFRSSASRGPCLWRLVPLGLATSHCGKGGGGVLPQTKRQGPGRRRPGRRPRGAPPDGHQWVPAPWFPPHTSRGEWGTGCGGSGRRFGAPSGPFRCLGSPGGGLESNRNPLKPVGTASGWCGIGNHHVPAKCARGYPRKRPGSTPNPKSGSEIAIDTRRTGIGNAHELVQ